MAIEGGYGQAAQFTAMARAAEQATFHVGKLMGQIALMQATTGTIGLAATAFANLERSLTLTNSVAQGTAQQFKGMDKAVRDFALATKFSASEGANALYFLASAGYSVEQSMQSMTGVMLLAQATLTDIGMTADTLAGSISAFKMEAKDTMRVANLFAASIAVSQASMDKLAFSMRQVAPVAASMGANIEETTTQLSVLYNVGLRGEQAGTALRNTMVRLMNPTQNAKEALNAMGISTMTLDGRMRKLKDILEDVAAVNNGAGPSVQTAKTIVEDEALPGFQALLAASDPRQFQAKMQDQAYAQRAQEIANRAGVTIANVRTEMELMELSIKNTNAASRMAMEQVTTLSGAFALARNGATEFAIAFGEGLAPALNSIAQLVTSAAVAFRGMSDEQKNIVTSLPLWAAGLWAVSKAAGVFLGSMNQIARLTAGDAFGITKGRSFMNNTLENFGQLERYNRDEFLRRNRFFDQRTGDQLNAVYTAAGVRRYQDPGTGRFVGAANVETRNFRPDGMGGYMQAPASYRGANLFGQTMNVLGLIGGVVGIATLVATIAPVVMDYFKNWNKEDASIKAVKLDDVYKQRRQSIELMGGSPLERDRNLGDQITSLKEYRTAAEGDSSYNQGKMARNAAAMRSLLLNRAMSPGANMPEGILSALNSNQANWGDIADQLKNLDPKLGPNGGNNRKLLGSMVGGGFLPEWNKDVDRLIRSLKPEQLEELKKLGKDYAKAKADVDRVNENLATYNDALTDLQAAQARVRASKDYSTAEAMERSKSNEKALEDAAKFTFFSQKFIDSVKKETRQNENALAKLRQSLISDSMGAFIAETQDQIFNEAREAMTTAENRAQTFKEQYSQEFAQLFDAANLFTGQDYYETKFNGNEVSRGDIKQGWISILENGGGLNAALDAFDEAIKTAGPMLAQKHGMVKAQIEQFIEEQKKQIKQTFEKLSIQRYNAFVDSFKDIVNKQQHIKSMSDMLVDQQLDMMKSVFDNAAEAWPELAGRLEVTSLIRKDDSLREKLKDYQMAFFDQFDKLAYADENSPAIKEFNKFKDSYLKNQTRALELGIEEIVQKTKLSRAKAADDLRVAQSELAASLAEIDQSVYRLTGDPTKLAAAGNADYLRTMAGIDNQIARTRENIRQLQAMRDNVGKAGSFKLDDLPNLQIPARTEEYYRESIMKLTEIARNTLNGGSGYGGSDYRDNAPGGTTRTNGGTGGGSWVDATIWRESRGNPFAKNPDSSATGLGQFLNETWINVIRKNQKLLESEGFSIEADNRDLLRQRTNPKLSRRAIELYGEENRSYLEGRGHSVGDTEMYLAHFLGAGGANKFLNAYERNPDGSARQAVGDKVVNANQNVFKGDITNAQFYQNIQESMATGAAKLSQALGTVAAATTGVNTAQTQSSQLQERLIAQLKEQEGVVGINITSIEQLKNKLVEKGVSAEHIAQVEQLYKDRLAEGTAELDRRIGMEQAALQKQQERAAAEASYNAQPGVQSYKQWEEEGIALGNLERSLTRTGSFMDGMRIKAQQMRHGMQTDFQIGASAFESFAGGMADLLAGLITGTVKDWKQALASLLQQIAAAILKALFLRAITSMFGGVFGSSDGNVIPSAKGNIFAGGVAVVRHATGGLVNSNQYFPMSNSGMVGSISETGAPEAIMPLARGPGGKLGVMLHNAGYQANGAPATTPITGGGRRGGGGGLNYNANFNIVMGGGEGGQQGEGADGRAAAAMKRDLDRTVEEAVIKVAQKHSRPGGMFHAPTKRLGQGV